MRGGEKRLNCRWPPRGRDPWQHDFPVRGLKPRRVRLGQISDLDHVNPVRQGRVQPGLHCKRVERRGKRDLEELGLASGAGRRPARVGNLRVRRESGRLGDRQAGPPDPPLHRPRDVPVTRESHPATLSVPDHSRCTAGSGAGPDGRAAADAPPYSPPAEPSSDGSPAELPPPTVPEHRYQQR